MVLNYIWIGFFVVAFIIALIKVIFLGDTEIFTTIMNSTFDSSKTAFEISLGLTGVLALWLGIMKVGENSGLINALARFLSPVLCRLFPDIPKGHPVLGSIFMNMSANMLGLDNAATPLGLKAMKELQELNPKKDTASNPMIMFLVINTSGLIIIPISIMVYRAQMGAAQPTDVFIPILLSTFISTLIGVIAVSIAQKINLINKPILILMGIICLFFSGLIYLFLSVSREDMGTYSTLIANILLFSVIILFILTGVRKKINVYDSFVEGAKEGFTTAVRIIPYLVAFLVGCGEGQGEKALGVLIVAGLLPFQTKLRVLRGIHHTQTDGTRAHQRDSQQGQRRVILTADEQQRQHCHQCAGGITDGGRNGQLDIPQAQIAQSHGTDIQQGHRQVGPDDGPADGRAAYEDLKGGVKAHHHAHGDDHFQVTVTVAAVPAADFRKEVTAAPAQEGGQGKPKPHGKGLLIEIEKLELDLQSHDTGVH